MNGQNETDGILEFDIEKSGVLLNSPPVQMGKLEEEATTVRRIVLLKYPLGFLSQQE